MAGAGIEIQAVDLLELTDALQRVRAERSFAVERMQDDPLQKIAERKVVILGQRLQNFQQALLYSNAGLYAFDNELSIFGHVGTNVRQRG